MKVAALGVVALMLSFAAGCPLLRPPAPTTPDQVKSWTVNVGKEKRSYYVWEPEGLDKTKATPVILLLHAGGSDAKVIAQNTGFHLAAEKQGFLVVAPEGTPAPGYPNRRVWNAHHCCTGPLPEQPDDLAFIRELLADLKGRYKVGGRRIYVVGLSNGGMLVHRLMAELPGTFAAGAAVAGTIGGKVEPKAKEEIPRKPTEAAPMLLIHGQKDVNVPFGGGTGGDGKRIDLSFDDSLQFWLSADRCDGKPVETKEGGIWARDWSCPGGVEVKALVSQSGAHDWPGGKTNPQDPLKANREILAFFSAHKRPE